MVSKRKRNGLPKRRRPAGGGGGPSTGSPSASSGTGPSIELPESALSTTERLAAALYVLTRPLHEELNELVERARNSYYHDFESPLALPTIQLVEDVRKWTEAGAIDEEEAAAFIERVKDGEFDATAEESEAWMEREGKNILARSFAPEEVRAEGNELAGMADVDKATYLTRRLFHLFEFLVSDPNVEYTRADLLMALHNAHVWNLLAMLDRDPSIDAQMRRMVLKSAADTFKARVLKEAGG